MRIYKTSSVIDIRLLLSLMVLLWCHFTALSQIQRPELIYVHFDKPFYVAGESIHYKVYFLYDNPVVSELVHFEIVDENGFVKEDQNLMISGNSAAGTIELPVSMQEGMYTARCYSLWNLNFGSEFIFYKDLPIYDAWKESATSQGYCQCQSDP